MLLYFDLNANLCFPIAKLEERLERFYSLGAAAPKIPHSAIPEGGQEVTGKVELIAE